MAERSPFPARTPIAAADGRASLPFSRWLLNEFDALASVRTTVMTGGAAIPAATYPQATGSVAIPAASYATTSAEPVFASYASGSALPLPFGEY